MAIGPLWEWCVVLDTVAGMGPWVLLLIVWQLMNTVKQMSTKYSFSSISLAGNYCRVLLWMQNYLSVLAGREVVLY